MCSCKRNRTVRSSIRMTRVGTTWFQMLVQKDSCLDVRYVIQSVKYIYIYIYTFTHMIDGSLKSWSLFFDIF